MEQSEEIKDLIMAVCRVQAILDHAPKKSTNPFFKSNYADLTTVWDTCKGPLTENDLAVIQTMDGNNGDIIIVTTLAHKSGQWIRGRLPVKPVKADPQAIGSAITYGRRYSLMAIIGMAPEDDDGEGAMARDKKTPTKEPEKKTSSNEKTPLTEAQGKKLFAMCKAAKMSNEDIGKFSDWLKSKYESVALSDGKVSLTKNGISEVFKQINALVAEFQAVAEQDGMRYCPIDDKEISADLCMPDDCIHEDCKWVKLSKVKAVPDVEIPFA